MFVYQHALARLFSWLKVALGVSEVHYILSSISAWFQAGIPLHIELYQLQLQREHLEESFREHLLDMPELIIRRKFHLKSNAKHCLRATHSTTKWK